MQTILGANGVIGVELARNLARYSDRIRLVSRNPRKVNQNDETLTADLTDAEETVKAVEGSTVAYLTVGLPYDLDVWRKTWPVVMRNVIEACKKHKAKLVFFDNVYVYGRVRGWMTEETPVRPSSRKGEVRELPFLALSFSLSSKARGERTCSRGSIDRGWVVFCS